MCAYMYLSFMGSDISFSYIISYSSQINFLQEENHLKSTNQITLQIIPGYEKL